MFNFLIKKRPAKAENLRKLPRFDVFVDADVIVSGQRQPARLSDLSQQGARLAMPLDKSDGRPIWLNWKGFEKLARVAWSDGEASGLQFDKPLTAGELDRILLAQLPG